MGHFLLPEAGAGIAQADIVAVILVGVIEIVLAFYVVAAAFLKQISVRQVTDIGCDRVCGDGVLPGTLLPGVQGIGDVVRVGQRADRGTEQIQRRRQYILAFDLLALHDILQIDLGKERFQIIHLCRFVRAGKDQRHTAEESIVLKGLRLVAAHRCVVLRKTQRMDTDLIAAAAKLGEDIAGEHAGIAAGYIDIQIIQRFQVVERVVKGDLLSVRIVGVRHLVGHLDLVHKEIPAIRLPLDPPTHGLRQLQRIAVTDIFRQIQLIAEDVILGHALLQQPALEDRAQQIALAAAADAGDDLDLPIPHEGDESIQIDISLNVHSASC